MIQNATCNTLVQFAIPDELPGRVMSVYMLVFQGLFPFGSLMAGTIAEHTTIPLGAAFGGSVALFMGLVSLSPHRISEGSPRPCCPPSLPSLLSWLSRTAFSLLVLRG